MAEGHVPAHGGQCGFFRWCAFWMQSAFAFAAAGILLCGPVQALLPKWKAMLYREDRVYAAECAVQLVLLFLCVMSLVSSTYNPFIYFRF